MEQRTEICARAEDLVAYLYKEATPAGAKDFELHMESCADCRSELAAFGDVREAVGEWRDQSLGSLSSPAFETHPALVEIKAAKPRRSALAALREFFTLSPAWMRAATGFAAIVFFALAAVAVIHFTAQPKVIVLEKPAQTEGIKKEETTKVAADVQSNEPNVNEHPVLPKENVAVNNQQSPKQVRPSAAASKQLIAKHRKIAPRSVNESPEEVVAYTDDYLPFTAPGREKKLPSLADLMDELN